MKAEHWSQVFSNIKMAARHWTPTTSHSHHSLSSGSLCTAEFLGCLASHGCWSSLCSIYLCTASAITKEFLALKKYWIHKITVCFCSAHLQQIIFPRNIPQSCRGATLSSSFLWYCEIFAKYVLIINKYWSWKFPICVLPCINEKSNLFSQTFFPWKTRNKDQWCPE